MCRRCHSHAPSLGNRVLMTLYARFICHRFKGVVKTCQQTSQPESKLGLEEVGHYKEEILYPPNYG